MPKDTLTWPTLPATRTPKDGVSHQEDISVRLGILAPINRPGNFTSLLPQRTQSLDYVQLPEWLVITPQ